MGSKCSISTPPYIRSNKLLEFERVGKNQHLPLDRQQFIQSSLGGYLPSGFNYDPKAVGSIDLIEAVGGDTTLDAVFNTPDLFTIPICVFIGDYSNPFESTMNTFNIFIGDLDTPNQKTAIATAERMLRACQSSKSLPIWQIRKRRSIARIQGEIVGMLIECGFSSRDGWVMPSSPSTYPGLPLVSIESNLIR